jgi:hypothetical protein
VVVRESILGVSPQSHEGYGEEEKQARKEEKKQRLRVEDPLYFGRVSASCIAEVVRNVEDKYAPGRGHVWEGLGECGARKESEWDDVGQHYDVGIGSQFQAGFIERSEVVLSLDARILVLMFRTYRNVFQFFLLQKTAFSLLFERFRLTPLISLQQKVINFGLVDIGPAKLDVNEHIKGVEPNSNEKIYYGNLRAVFFPKSSGNDNPQYRYKQPWDTCPHCEFGDHFLGEVVDHGKIGKLGEIDAQSDDVGAEQKDGEAMGVWGRVRETRRSERRPRVMMKLPTVMRVM